MQYHTEPTVVMRPIVNKTSSANGPTHTIPTKNIYTSSESTRSDKIERCRVIGSDSSSIQECSQSWSSSKSSRSKRARGDKEGNGSGCQDSGTKQHADVDASGSTSSGAGSLSVKTEKPSRVRRSTSQLSRPFVCMYDRCGRAYSTKHARQLHYRLKHSQGSIFNELAPSATPAFIAAQPVVLPMQLVPIMSARRFAVGGHIRNNLPVPMRPVPVSCAPLVVADNRVRPATVQQERLTENSLNQFNTQQGSNMSTGTSSVAAIVDCSRHPLRLRSDSSSPLPGNEISGQLVRMSQGYGTDQNLRADISAGRRKRLRMSIEDYPETRSSQARLEISSSKKFVFERTPMVRKDQPHNRRKKKYVSKRNRSHSREEDCPVHGAKRVLPCMNECCRRVSKPFEGMFDHKPRMNPMMADPPSFGNQTVVGDNFDSGYGQNLKSRYPSGGNMYRQAQYNEATRYQTALYDQNALPVATNQPIAHPYAGSGAQCKDCPVHSQPELSMYTQEPYTCAVGNDNTQQVESFHNMQATRTDCQFSMYT